MKLAFSPFVWARMCDMRRPVRACVLFRAFFKACGAALFSPLLDHSAASNPRLGSGPTEFASQSELFMNCVYSFCRRHCVLYGPGSVDEAAVATADETAVVTAECWTCGETCRQRVFSPIGSRCSCERCYATPGAAAWPQCCGKVHARRRLSLWSCSSLDAPMGFKRRACAAWDGGYRSSFTYTRANIH